MLKAIIESVRIYLNGLVKAFINQSGKEIEYLKNELSTLNDEYESLIDQYETLLEGIKKKSTTKKTKK